MVLRSFHQKTRFIPHLSTCLTSRKKGTRERDKVWADQPYYTCNMNHPVRTNIGHTVLKKLFFECVLYYYFIRIVKIFMDFWLRYFGAQYRMGSITPRRTTTTTTATILGFGRGGGKNSNYLYEFFKTTATARGFFSPTG